jgi:alanyl-tRNA synthetase
MKTPTEIRELFLKYFENQGHRRVPSAPLVPRSDPTLLFTNAGMNQFKGIFTGQEKADFVRAVSSQKCVRAGGKHNDLENVGHTARHHTFFEMLGNFSFGDYFKREAIRLAWKFVTEDLGLPKDRLYVTVFKDDEEAAFIWNKEMGIEAERIYKFGVKDNFWSMGDTGPCGPCSEIFYDQGADVGCGRAECEVGCDCDRYIEFWNLVFMEFEQKANGVREKLPKPSIDTGMGLERVSAIVAGAKMNYDTELFTPIFEAIGSLSGKSYKTGAEEEKVSMRVIADHVRCMTFLISDGVHPSNEGRGYVLRRIMRRAMRHGRKLGLMKPFLHELSGTVVKIMSDAYPELKKNSAATASAIKAEEQRFAETIDRGLSLLEDEIEKLTKDEKTVLSGKVAFHLYDTYGFPVDLTADMLREKGMKYDMEGFEAAFSEHREKARGTWKGSGEKAIDSLVRTWVDRGIKSEFRGYEETQSEGTITVLVKGGKEVQSAKGGDEVELIADRTPFYGESGGQVGDIGTISGGNFSLEVVDTKKAGNEILVHKCRVTEGGLSVGERAIFSVEASARSATAKNHTATHMLHATLKEVLGSGVKQAGSLVAPERLRFDFSHSKALSKDEIAAIELKMNERIWLNSTVDKKVLPLKDALASGAVALFDEKYGDKVRVISMGDYSMELCGGTHLTRTGEIGMFKIIKESSVASGVRRIEALTGYAAYRYMQESDHKLKGIANALGSSPEEIDTRIEKLVQKHKELEKELKKRRSAGEGAQANVTTVNGVTLSRAVVEASDHKELREMADRELAKLKSGIVAVGSKQEGKAFVVIKVSKDLSGKYDAGKLIRGVAELLGGSGGGRPDMAQAGGTKIDQLPAAIDSIEAALR